MNDYFIKWKCNRNWKHTFEIRSVGNKKCDQKKSPNVYKSCRKMTSLEKLDILTPLQKLSKNVGLPKVQ